MNENDDELKAEQEIKTAIETAKDCSPSDLVDGLGASSAVLHLQFRPSQPKKELYDTTLHPNEKPLLLTYFAIKGLGEVPKLMLAECGAHYDQIAPIGGEDQSIAMEWRARSPNGLLPIISGAGIPRAAPIAQSGAIIRFLAERFGMEGKTSMEKVMADVLYETAKDISNKKDSICAIDPEKDLTKAKEPFALASRVEKMLSEAYMPDPKDETVPLNFGQIQLFHVLMNCEDRRTGCVKENLGDKLEEFRVAMEKRSRISAYLKSNACFPNTKGELGIEGGGYTYVSGPLKRGDIKF
eukprot:CAMPEP_0195511060 /NCGR_PEP_ID=MMETSP0794_2-20130614/3516_1 /TAXON_ID=515487 /ORGANISM="Stephanopyxis turris, Strain CCMP 815" /LENGTH=296 /DNA_ID=CAMNT_0040638603 /DNA_START=11 /DNA_END=901 /DNA_ORIENTATION=+